jgi:2-amino-4-hydroxy-6-hydroxymethyldihydropteridine diphosphokinase
MVDAVLEPVAPSLAIALGANLGDPRATLEAVRPLLAAELERWWPGPAAPRLRWSPLFRTEPVGGPADQPDYLNAVVLADPLSPVAEAAALSLLAALQALEARFGRQRREHWGPRSLDLDLLWCGPLSLDQPGLTLPHPRLGQRSFVLAPLAAIDPQLLPPGRANPCSVDPARNVHGAPDGCVGHLLANLLPRLAEAPPQPLAASAGWP